MKRNTLLGFSGVTSVALAALVLLGCNGKTGPAGTSGQNGTDGTPGTNATTAVDARVMTPEAWAALKPTVKVNSVTMGGAPVVKFTVTDLYGNGLKGLASFTTQSATATLPSYANVSFSIAKLVPEDSVTKAPSKWVNYIVTTVPTYKSATDKTIVPAAPAKPTTDNTGNLVDNGDGSYTYTFYRDITKSKDILAAATQVAPNDVADLGDVTYDASLTHRLTIQISGYARGTGSNTPDGVQVVNGVPMLNPANLVYDFIPATGQPVAASNTQRQMMNTNWCNTCHTKLAFHQAGGRVEVQYCVMCHTDQRKYGNYEALTTSTGYTVNTTDNKSTAKINGMATGDFVNLVHKIHMGEELSKDGYNYAGVKFNEVTYPQDLRNCVKCHSNTAATPQGDNWNQKPSILACGACHDGVNFATGANHGANKPTTDDTCAGCHDAAAIKASHIPVVAPNPANSWNGGTNANTNAAYIASYTSNLPTGAKKVTWDLSSVSLNASRQPQFKFRFLLDGSPVVFNTSTGTNEMMDGFMGSPSVYLAFAVPEDGITTPADWNATVSGYIKKIWNGTATGTGAGTFSGPDGTGYYTITLTGVKIPTTATLLTGGLGYTYSLSSAPPLTQITGLDAKYALSTDGKNQGGLMVPAPNVWKAVDSKSTRRAIVTTAKCNDCHAALGVFTASAYHAGQRNDGPTCTFCHTPNRVNSGWSVNIKDVVHALHASSMRANKFSWEASAGDKFWDITYPAILNNCEACHVPGSYDFSNSASSSALPNLLWSTVATGATDPAAFPIITGSETVMSSSKVISPFITAGTNYGTGFTTNFATASTTPYTDATGATLVNSPITAACVSCHDSKTAIAHMKANGGAFYEARTTALTKLEQCMLCHGTGKTADIKTVHMTF